MTSVLEFEARLAATPDRRTAVRLRDDLSAALREAGAVQVDEVDVGMPPPGRRAGEVEIVGLVVSFAGTLATVFQVLREWLGRRAGDAEGGTTITVRIGDASVTIADPPTPAELNVIVELIERHDGTRE